jgi:hypothetical protein
MAKMTMASTAISVPPKIQGLEPNPSRARLRAVPVERTGADPVAGRAAGRTLPARVANSARCFEVSEAVARDVFAGVPAAAPETAGAF